MMNQMIPLTVANTLDQSIKQRIEVSAKKTVKQAVQDAKLAPKGQFDVFDAFGKVVSQQNVGEYRDKTIYVGVQRVAGGRGGIPLNRLVELKVDFPSIQPVNQHTDSKHTDMIMLKFPSAGRTTNGFWQIVIHCPNVTNHLPHTYILNFKLGESRPGISVYSGGGPNVHYGSTAKTIPGTRKTAHWVCHGNILPILNNIGEDPIKRMGAYINHIQNLLNS